MLKQLSSSLFPDQNQNQAWALENHEKQGKIKSVPQSTSEEIPARGIQILSTQGVQEKEDQKTVIAPVQEKGKATLRSKLRSWFGFLFQPGITSPGETNNVASEINISKTTVGDDRTSKVVQNKEKFTVGIVIYSGKIGSLRSFSRQIFLPFQLEFPFHVKQSFPTGEKTKNGQK